MTKEELQRENEQMREEIDNMNTLSKEMLQTFAKLLWLTRMTKNPYYNEEKVEYTIENWMELYFHVGKLKEKSNQFNKLIDVESISDRMARAEHDLMEQIKEGHAKLDLH